MLGRASVAMIFDSYAHLMKEAARLTADRRGDSQISKRGRAL